MDTRALGRLSLIVGLIILIASAFVTARTHFDESAEQLLLVLALALGIFLLLAGLINVLSERPLSVEEEEEELAEVQVFSGKPPSIATALGIYILVLSLVAGVIVGVMTEDVGAGIQTFTFGLILSGAIAGIGLLLGYRPTAEE